MRYARSIAAFCCVFCLLFAGCQQQTWQKGQQVELDLYCLTTKGMGEDSWQLTTDTQWVEQAEAPEDFVKGILTKMKQIQERDKEPAIPPGVMVTEVVFYGNSVIVNLSPEFNELEPVQRSLAAAAIAKTLDQLDGIDFVKVSCATENYEIDSDFYLDADSLVLDESAIQFNAFDVTLYLLDRHNGYAEPIVRTIKTEEKELTLEMVFAELAHPEEGSLLQSPVPQGMEVPSIAENDGICVLNFAQMTEEQAGQMDALAIRAIVDTMCSQEGIRGVLLRVAGRPLSYYGINGYDGVLS